MKCNELSDMKDHLSQLKKSKQLIERLWDFAEAPVNPSFVTTSKIQKKVDSLRKEIINYIDLLSAPSDQFHEAINQIPDPDQQAVLRNRYDLMYSWEDIADELNFSTQWLHELHRRALKALQAIYERSDPA